VRSSAPAERPSSEQERRDLTLLEANVPFLRYAPGAVRAIGVQEYLQHPSATLRSGRTGEVIASAAPGKGEPRLSLDFLRAKRYPNGREVDRGDRIEVDGSYRDWVERLAERPRHRDVVYGRVVDGRYLEYWLFLPDNNSLQCWGDRWPGTYGDHPSDWEKAVVRLDPERRAAERIAFSQHKGVEVRSPDHAELIGRQVVAYVSGGNNALNFRRSCNWAWRNGGATPDCNYGTGPLVRPTVRLFGPWGGWPGNWPISAPVIREEWDRPEVLFR
jgi:hypothetical protein